MQTYAVVDCDFKFVKIGRTGDLPSRLATLNTASPRELILMALFDGDIEQEMHRLLSEFRERLEWFRYGERTESEIVARMTPTKAWFIARGIERKRRRKAKHPEQMGPIDVSVFSRRQLDGFCSIARPGTDHLGTLFGIPDEGALAAIIDRSNKAELIATRRLLSECGRKVAAEIEENSTGFAPSSDRMTRALFARAVIKNWKRRVGMELGSIMNRSGDLTISVDS